MHAGRCIFFHSAKRNICTEAAGWLRCDYANSLQILPQHTSKSSRCWHGVLLSNVESVAFSPALLDPLQALQGENRGPFLKGCRFFFL